MNKAAITTRSFAIECPPDRRVWSEIASRIDSLGLGGGWPIRLIVAAADERRLVFEASFLETDRRPCWPSLLEYNPLRSRAGRKPFVAVSIVPTGVRAEIGGFAGDATPSTNLLATACDCLITNPNSVTASDIYNAAENIFYLEGNLITRFALGQLDLLLEGPRSIGALIEKPKYEKFLNNVLNALNAMRATGGIRIEPVVVTGREISAQCVFSPHGYASGSFSRMDDLLEGCGIIAESGAEAVAVSSTLVLDDDVRKRYYERELIPNPWGGAEAIITHTVTSLFPVTAAHAPLLADLSHSMFGTLVDPRDSAELISTSYICSVIKGLSRSPRPVAPDSVQSASSPRVSIADVSAIVMPANAVGNILFFSALEQDVPLVLVRENNTQARVSPEELGIDQEQHRNIHFVNSYLEATGLLMAMKAGISAESIARPLEALEPVYLGKKKAGEKNVATEPGRALRA